ncbi:MAG TPA: CHAT domain-containing protein, partial [Phaeodactylibacter sp.]|nr:CHAT domain-containing protein [Phaeodactylibacter sp.]
YLFGYLGDKAKVLHLLANKENNSTYLASALQLYQLGDALIDQLRKEHQDQDTKLFWRKQAIPFYENAIGTCYQMQDVENAFFFFEKSKAILLLEAMQTSGALQMIPDSIRNEFQVLQRKLLQTKESLEQATTVQKEIITKNLVELQQKLETKTEQLAEVYPKYFDIKYGTNTRSLADVQKEFSASKEKTGVHFFYGKKNIYALTINAKNSKLYQLGATPTIETEIKNFLSFFQKSSAIENAPADFLQQAQNIYAILLAPLSLGTQEELIIFPDGALAYLPFEALVTAPSEEIGAADYLIKKHIIHYGYSATIFSKQNKNQTKLLHHGIAAFAPFADASAGAAYATLDFSKDELGEISQELEGVFLKNKEATKQAFLSKIKDVSVLHLSTHAFSSPTESKPRIVFADTSLFLSELYGLDISANLVVLSACQSNIGKLSQGEGVMSLGRGFTFAGAKSLVSSLWNVNAVATSNILSDFYKKIENNTPKYQALHAAKKAYLENEKIPSYERSPYYWAGLIYYGDDGGVVLQKKTSNFLFVKVLLFGLVLLAGFYFSRGRGVTASSGNTS